ncbi:MAG TPA: DUF6252 family protein [Mucilaginibacter sp.]|jgi:hypothetical protein|nr:DUF6252 family protein [Mucilaginibacter sp.]
MKKIKYLYFIAAASAFLFCSCSKKNNPAPFAPVISLKFNDTAFSTTNMAVSFPHDTVLINGQFAGQGLIALSIPNAKVGSFDVATSGATFQFANGPAAQDLYTATSGTIVVTSLTSNTIAGTFAVSVDNVAHTTKTITDGQFQANLP